MDIYESGINLLVYLLVRKWISIFLKMSSYSFERLVVNIEGKTKSYIHCSKKIYFKYRTECSALASSLNNTRDASDIIGWTCKSVRRSEGVFCYCSSTSTWKFQTYFVRFKGFIRATPLEFSNLVEHTRKVLEALRMLDKVINNWDY